MRGLELPDEGDNSTLGHAASSSDLASVHSLLQVGGVGWVCWGGVGLVGCVDVHVYVCMVIVHVLSTYCSMWMRCRLMCDDGW